MLRLIDSDVLDALSSRYVGKMSLVSCADYADPGSVRMTLLSFSGIVLLFGASLLVATFILIGEMAVAGRSNRNKRTHP
jgi:hypothetical protein